MPQVSGARGEVSMPRVGGARGEVSMPRVSGARGEVSMPRVGGAQVRERPGGAAGARVGGVARRWAGLGQGWAGSARLSVPGATAFAALPPAEHAPERELVVAPWVLPTDRWPHGGRLVPGGHRVSQGSTWPRRTPGSRASCCHGVTAAAAEQAAAAHADARQRHGEHLRLHRRERHAGGAASDAAQQLVCCGAK